MCCCFQGADTRVNFVLTEMTFLRYFMPLIIEGNKRGINSTIFLCDPTSHQKYTQPDKYKDTLVDLGQKHNFKIKYLDEIKNYSGITFLIEAVGFNLVHAASDLEPFLAKKYKKIVLTYMTDFEGSYEHYINKVDYVTFPSKSFAEHYNCLSDKNIYLGSTKYDVDLNEEEIKEKYSLTNEKKALVVFPRLRDMHKINLIKLYQTLYQMGFKILVKTRGKDPVPAMLRGDYYFEDDSWYPHTTMELIKVSDIVINFSSTVIKETIMLNKPIVNFSIKPHKHLDFLYNYDFCRDLTSPNELEPAIDYLLKTDLKKEYNKAIQEHLFPPGSSKRIIDFVCAI